MVNHVNLTKASSLLRAIAHPVRLAIIQYIAVNGSTNVNKIYNTLKLEQSITSQHLRVLRTNQLVSTTRDGKFIYYKVNYGKIQLLNAQVKQFFIKKVDIDQDLLQEQYGGNQQLATVVKSKAKAS